jgi:mycothiol synthase
VAPDARGAGVGRALADAVLDALPAAEITAWSHGNHPAAARLAADLGFARTRDLWVMRRPLTADPPLPAVAPADGITVRTFTPGEDEEPFLALNAEAFVDHPEQGKMTRSDLDARMAEPWFDPDGFFVAVDAAAPAGPANDAVESPSLLGFHWTKVHRDQDPPVGEVYVVGISPAAQGRGLGTLLTLTGLHHLRDRGLDEVILYVEGDNAPAIAVYSGLGFTHAAEDTDLQYLRPARA